MCVVISATTELRSVLKEVENKEAKEQGVHEEDEFEHAHAGLALAVEEDVDSDDEGNHMTHNTQRQYFVLLCAVYMHTIMLFFAFLVFCVLFLRVVLQ